MHTNFSLTVVLVKYLIIPWLMLVPFIPWIGIQVIEGIGLSFRVYSFRGTMNELSYFLLLNT